jgi:hypothetical protein
MDDLFGISNDYVIVYSPDEHKNFHNHCKFRKFTDDVPSNFKLVEKIINPHKGASTDADFFVFKKNIT